MNPYRATWYKLGIGKRPKQLFYGWKGGKYFRVGKKTERAWKLRHLKSVKQTNKQKTDILWPYFSLYLQSRWEFNKKTTRQLEK